MAEVITMPKLGFDMHEGTLVRWVKKEGDQVNKGDVIAEIETDKATVEVEAFASGVLRKTLAAEGAVLPIGEPIGVIGGADEAIDLAALGVGKQPEAQKPAEKPAAKPVPKPAAGDGAQAPAGGQAPLPAVDSGAPGAQPMTHPEAQPPGEMQQATVPTSVGGASAPAPTGDGRVVASPVARRIADERGIDLRQVRGSGPGGRITRKDVENFVPPAPEAAAPAAEAAAALEGPAYGEKPLTRIRQIIARRMAEAKQQVPHFYVTVDVDMAAAMALRKQVNEFLDDAHKLSVNDLIVKAAAAALREFPALNASFGGDKVVVHEHVNIGVAVALSSGLTTVVVRDADRKTLSQIAAEGKGLIERARTNKVRPEDMEGSTFTVSNLGMFDVEHFIGIINPPEAALLALGSVQEVPVVKDGQLAVGSRMKATLSADHRVTDGAEVARFMQVFRRMLETPARMLV